MNNQNYTISLKSVRDFIYRNYMEKEKLISFVDFRIRPKSRKDCSLHPAMIIWGIMVISERCAQSKIPSCHSVSRFQNCSIFQFLNYILNLLPLMKIWLMMWLSKYCSEQWKMFVDYNVHSGINPIIYHLMIIVPSGLHLTASFSLYNFPSIVMFSESSQYLSWPFS